MRWGEGEGGGRVRVGVRVGGGWVRVRVGGGDGVMSESRARRVCESANAPPPDSEARWQIGENCTLSSRGVDSLSHTPRG